MRKPRNLSGEERALWERATAKDTPLHSSPRAALLSESPPKTPATPESALSVPTFRVGQKASAARPHDILPPLADRLSTAPVNMDSKSFGRMKRGKLKPEGRIDLHGMTQSQAHPALTRFILDAHAKGRRLVLVITGKGKDRDDGGPIPTRFGVLRHQVPQWLALPPVASVVLQVTPAHLRHGGDGAYYVYLRRHR
ncbi:MAG: Smr/MutS family protein [Pseudomonadota bacterium]